jgi:hypothetical protein
LERAVVELQARRRSLEPRSGTEVVRPVWCTKCELFPETGATVWQATHVADAPLAGMLSVPYVATGRPKFAGFMLPHETRPPATSRKTSRIDVAATILEPDRTSFKPHRPGD